MCTALTSAMGCEVGGGRFGVDGCGEDSPAVGCDATLLFHCRANPFPHPVHAFADRLCDCGRHDVHYCDDSYLQILTGNCSLVFCPECCND